MTVRATRRVLLGLLALLVLGVGGLETAVRLGWITPARPPAEEALGLPGSPLPYYTPRREGPLDFVGPIVDNKSAPGEADEGWTPVPGEGTPPAAAEDETAATWKKWEKYEATFRLNWTFRNPYDPDEIAVDAVVTPPSGKVEVVPAFWYVPCERRLVDRTRPVKSDEDTPKIEVIEALPDPEGKRPDRGTWMLRYTPREEGEFRYVLVARTPTASAQSEARTFRVSGSQGHGFARVSSLDRRYFEFDDGTFFFPIGLNVGWPNDEGSANFEQYMVNLRAAGANWARVWLAPYFQGTAIEWSRTNDHYTGRLGFYSAEVAWKLDRMLDAAARNGIALMWCLVQHSRFSTSYNPCWDENPYNREAGGFLDSPEQFFTHPRARKLFRRRLRYLVARYGWAPNLFAWELWNEVALTDKFSAAASTAWHKEMADALKALDPTGRMVTTSYGRPFYYNTESYREAYGLDSHDFVQVHIYHGGAVEYLAWLVRSVEAQMGELDDVRRYGKPILIGEYGLGHDPRYFRVEADSKWPVDPPGLHVHNSLWIGLFSGSAGTAMNWWWDRYIHRNNLYFHFRGIRRFLDGEDLRRWGLRRVKLFDDPFRRPEVLAYVLSGRDRAYGWVFETAYTLADFGPPDAPRRDVTIELEDLADGDAWVEFWDTYDGVVVARSKVVVRDGRVRFTVPPFRGDIAFKVVRKEPAGPVATETPIHDRMVERLRALAERFGRRGARPAPEDGADAEAGR